MSIEPSEVSSAPLDTGQRAVVLAWLSLAVTVYPWETANYFTGTANSVQTAKAGIDCVALIVALGVFSARKHDFQPPMTPIILLIGAAVASCAGAVLPNYSLVSTSSNLVAAARVAIVFAGVYLCARVLPVRTLWNALLGLLSGVMLLAIVETYVLGMPRYQGRMSLYHPQVPPNTIAIGAVVVALHFGVRWLIGQRLSLAGCLALPLCALTLLGTGTRGALVSLAVGVAAVVLTQVVPPGRLGATLLLGAGAFLAMVLVASHGVPGSFVRPSNTGLLDSRAGTWSAVLHQARTPASWLFGNGANNTVVAIPFNGWALAAPINNGWLMAFVQSGLVGVVALAGELAFAFSRVRRLPRHVRGPLTGTLAAICCMSITEAGFMSVAILGVILVAFTFLADAAIEHRSAEESEMATPPFPATAPRPPRIDGAPLPRVAVGSGH
jgi:hypothetical protein